MFFIKKIVLSSFIAVLFSGFTFSVQANDLSWDMDSDGSTNALTDGLLMLRYAFGIRGNSLTKGVISDPSNLTISQIESRLQSNLLISDIDGNGKVDALTDGLILMRYLFNIKNESMISAAVASEAPRSSVLEIYQYLIDHNPGMYSGGLPNTLIINEAVSSNSSFEDEDGDTPDWFELYNNKSTAIDLTGWTVTDDQDKPTKWRFPDIQIGAGEYLRIWASDKDKADGGTYRTLINQGDNFRFLVPTSNPPSTWKTLSFDDSTWQIGKSGFGYADGDDETQIDSGISSVYVRKSFTINNFEQMTEVWFDIDFDDGFVAYINGTEIARSNILGESPSFDTVTVTDREALMYQSGAPVRFPVNDFETLLTNGENILSIQVHNHNSNSSDLSLIPFLSSLYSGTTTDGKAPPAILGFQDPSLHTNFKLSSKGETLVIYDDSGNQVGFLEVAGISSDNSIGRSLTNGETVYYETPSPGAENPDTLFTGIIESEIVFSHDGGEFDGQSVTISGAEADEEIRYTLDATVPSESSPIYVTPIAISDNTVIRAKIFKANHIPSRTESRTYITNTDHSLPIVTLVSNPANFFDTQQGIYIYGPEGNYNPYELPFFGANFWNDWERDVHFSFYETNGDLGVALDAGVKIFGAWSRGNDQRSMSIFARGRYGFSDIEYPIFPQLDYDKFEAIVLRNSGNDWMRTNIKDVIATSLMDGSGLETQAYRSSVVYLNGEYWGLYNIREKVNEHFLDDKINVSKSEINILERNGEIVEGTNETYNDLIGFVTNNDLSIQANYEFVADQIDIDNYITYQVAQIYFDNTDWPGNNIKFWNSPETKWRWILYDTDFSFGRPWEAPPFYDNDTLSYALEANGPGWPNPPWSTLLFRKLMENTEFRNKFINHFADESNSRFKAISVRQHVENIANSVAPEIPKHFQQWSSWENRSVYWQNEFMLSTYEQWVAEIDKIKKFTDNRIPYLTNHFKNYFGIDDTHTLTVEINNTEAGSIKINSLSLSDSSWQGEYFDNIPISIEAIANEGFTFSRWIGVNEDNNSQISIAVTSDITVKALFVAE